MTDKTEQTRRLNDLARTQPESVNCTWVITRGLAQCLAGDDTPADPAPAQFAPQRVAALRAALASFCDWDPGNDPYQERDFGAFDLFGERLFFKIDYIIPTTIPMHQTQPASRHAAGC